MVYQVVVLQTSQSFQVDAIYMCGSPAMISDAKQAFVAHGADLEHIYTDGFSFQHASQAA
jgi:CDP-4-dehydro-6-deoxyglucose reductase, E3